MWIPIHITDFRRVFVLAMHLRHHTAMPVDSTVLCHGDIYDVTGL